MRIIGNILWHFPFFGFVTAFLTFILGCILVLLVITAPLGLGLIQLAKFELLPFNYEMIDKSEIRKVENSTWEKFSFVIMILYYPFGILVALLTVIQIAFLFISILGIPMALVMAKSLSTYLNPVNKICVPRGVKDIIAQKKAEAVLNQHAEIKAAKNTETASDNNIDSVTTKNTETASENPNSEAASDKKTEIAATQNTETALDTKNTKC